jgi:uncharacterized protein (DUF58 family)
MEVDDLKRTAEAYGARNVQGHLIQVFDPAEEDLPFEGRVRFEGIDSPGSVTLGRVQSVRDAYKKRWHNHQEELASYTRKIGWRFLRHRTDHSPEQALLSLFMSLSDGSAIRRAGS